MPMAEWDVPFLLKSPEGEIKINEPQGGTGDAANDLYLLDETKCTVGISTLRTLSDDSPQSDGAIFHRSFKSFEVMNLDVEFWQGPEGETAASEREPACGADRARMLDNLMAHLNALVDPELADLEGGNCQIRWDPSAGDDRMLNQIRLLTWPQETIENPVFSLGFELDSPFPYSMDVSEQTTDIDATVVVTNAGTTDFFPVFRIHGPFSSFSLQNVETLLFFDYDASFPGAAAVAAGHYAEVNTFGNTVFLDGNGANLMAGIDVTISDFWTLIRGAQELSYTSDNALSSCEMLWNNAWAT